MYERSKIPTRGINWDDTRACDEVIFTAVRAELGAVSALRAQVHVAKEFDGLPSGPGRVAAFALLATILVVAFLPVWLAWPDATLGGELRSGLEATGAPIGGATYRPSRVAITLAVPVLIGVVAALLAWPAAWSVGVRRSRGMALAGTVMLMPPALAYSGWGLIRAPGTMLGNAIERLGEHGLPELVAFAGQSLAVVGLSLWAAPLAAGVGSLVNRSIRTDVVDAMVMDCPGRWSRIRLAARLSLPGFLAGAGIVAAVMLGSAVPLHLAQIPTISIDLWLMLDHTPRERWWQVGLAAWPLLLTAGVVGVLVSAKILPGARRCSDSADSPASERARRGSWKSGWWPLGLLWTLGVGMPAALLLLSIRRWSAWHSFWEISGDALTGSLLRAAACGTVAGVLTACFFAAWCGGRWARRTAAGVLMALSALAFIPGVLVGALLATGFSREGWEWVADSWLIVILAHIARYGLVAGLIAAWLTRLDAATVRELRLFDGAVSFSGFIAASGPGLLAAMGVAGAAVAALSVQEIEASVMVQPPGVESFARQVLGHLHFSRLDELAVSLVVLVGVGSAMAGVAWIMSRWASLER